MRVRAINTGFYHGLHVPGTDSEEFDVPDGEKASWFVPVTEAGTKGKKGALAPANPAGPDGADAGEGTDLV
ncbi:hypothetical protein [Oryzomicrobium sp.]|uniref:hypothetical protein n=1 Tax=Oryzomicrobium sp. TaxID=1911578 RepID=UPI002FE4071E